MLGTGATFPAAESDKFRIMETFSKKYLRIQKSKKKTQKKQQKKPKFSNAFSTLMFDFADVSYQAQNPFSCFSKKILKKPNF